MRESDSKCCGECATGECGNLDRIAALERELAKWKGDGHRAAELTRDANALAELRALERDVISKERDEAHAAIREIAGTFGYLLKLEQRPPFWTEWFKEHAPAIRRASEKE